MISNNPQAKGINQKIKYFDYLKINVATNSMVADATGIPQKNLTRFKREFEDLGLLHELHKGICNKTKHRATYLTTNPDLIPQSNQLKMF
jgi:hypothetical protein